MSRPLLELMLNGLQGKNPLPVEKPVIIMDASIASVGNVAWLIEHGYLYLVISRERHVPKTLGACPRIENLLRKSPFGQIYRSFSLNRATIRLK